MNCSGIDILNPYSWIIFSGLLAGVAVTGLLKGKRPNWTFFSFFLSGSFLLALLGLFFPGPENFLDIQLLFFFTGSVATGIAATWFWKSIGLALFLLASLSIIFIPIALRPWHCLSESIELGRFRLLSQAGLQKTIEIDTGEADGSSYLKLDEDSVEIEIDILTTERYYFFLKARSLYRVKRGIPFKEEILSGLPEYALRLMQNYHSRIPGIAFLSVTSGKFRPVPLTTYVIKLELKNGIAAINIERLYL